MEYTPQYVLAFMISLGIFSTTAQNSVSTITSQNLTNSEKATFLADYFLQHELESHYVYESVMASRDMMNQISSGNTSASQELLDAIKSYVLTSLPGFLRNPIVQGIFEVIADELGIALQNTDLNIISSQLFSDEDIQKLCSEFNYVRTLTRSITIAKPLIERYRQENDSTVFIILLNKAIEMAAYTISTPTFQTVMEIVVDELSQGFLKSGLPERIDEEGTGFLNDEKNTLSIVKTIIESSNMERLMTRSYIASKPVLDLLYKGDTLFLFATFMTATGASQNPAYNYMFEVFETDFIKTYNKHVNSAGDVSSLINDPLNSYINVIEKMNVLGTFSPMFRAASARNLLPYNSSAEEDKISDICYEDTIHFLDEAKNEKAWALKMVDSFGKMPAGMSKGNLNLLGSMDQCVEVRSEIKANKVLGTVRYPRSFGTRFCRVIIPSNGFSVRITGRITWGVCLPDTCTSSDVYGLMKLDALENITGNVEKVECLIESDLSKDLPAIITLIIIGFLVFLCLCGTIYVSLEERGIISNNQESVKLNGVFSALDSKKEGEYEQTEDLKNVSVESNCTTKNGDRSSEPNGLHADDEKPAPDTTHQNSEVQPNDVLKSEGSTGNESTNQENSLSRSGKKEGILIKVIKAFALQINIPKILAGKTSSKSISCLHGIRFITITWVILVHSYFHGLTHNYFQVWTLVNPSDYLELKHSFTFHGVMASNSAVDTFFLLSGMLLSYTQIDTLTKLMKKVKGSRIGVYAFHYFFHRLWRLTPLYVMVLLIYATLTEHLSNGPLKPFEFAYRQYCKNNWWTNMLYINNLIKRQEQCMGWSWYLANDMQFYTVSLVILLLMALKLSVGIIISVLVMLSGIGIAMWRQYIFNGNLLRRFEDGGAYWENIYIAPWCRVAAYMVGILFGIFMRKRPRKPFNKMIGFAGWTIATAVALTLKYSIYSFNREGGEPWTKLQNAFYEAFDRPVWAMCVAWVVFACHNNMGGPVNSLLSWKGFVPLSRLTFSCYLIHPVVMLVHGFSRRALFYVTDYNMVHLFLGNLTVSFMSAFLLTVTIESPFIALEKLMF
ncbi:O-acyltransferase like protein-like [Ylistrum balloti]|uniref:O-acyltransferase like protein-like n=1 Tax=Ylistrum balloti TaxID=509963 RepID=UPI002905C98E|nr:O-acyltransferase like protein-like [Ylistrum balloti]